jgi:hypothetical protein
MTRGDDMAQSPSPTEPKWGWLGWPVRCWHHFNFRFANVSRRIGAWGIQFPKSVEAELGGKSATCMADRLGFGELPPQINGGAHSLHL